MTKSNPFVFSSFLVIPFYFISSSLPTSGAMKSERSEPESPISRRLVIASVAIAQFLALFLVVSFKKTYPKTFIEGIPAAQAVPDRAEFCAKKEAQDPGMLVVAFQSIERFAEYEICYNVEYGVAIVFCHVYFALAVFFQPRCEA